MWQSLVARSVAAPWMGRIHRPLVLPASRRRPEPVAWGCRLASIPATERFGPSGETKLRIDAPIRPCALPEAGGLHAK